MIEKRGHIGMNVHNTKTLDVLARDIDTFWTLQITSRDHDENIFAVDLYVSEFDADQMQAYADALREGADRVEKLAERKCACVHADLIITEVATCEKCDEKFDIFDKE